MYGHYSTAGSVIAVVTAVIQISVIATVIKPTTTTCILFCIIVEATQRKQKRTTHTTIIDMR